jgi:hypothetical protein
MTSGKTAMRASWIIMIIVVGGGLISVNPRFAWLLVLIPLALALRIWRRRGWRPRPLVVLLAALALGLVLFLSATFLLVGDDDPTSPPYRYPSVGLPAEYSGIFDCEGRCAQWTTSEALQLTVPPTLYTRAGKAITRDFASDGWRLADVSSVVEAGVQIRLTRSIRQNQPAARIWPLISTQKVVLPDSLALTGTFLNLSLPPSADRRKLLIALGWEPEWIRSSEKLPIMVEPRIAPASKLTLRYPRHGVLATTPTSAGGALAGGREERVITVSDVQDGKVQLDLLSPPIRSDPAVKAVSLTRTGWTWFILLGLIGIAIVPYVRGKGESLIPTLLKRRRQHETPEAHPRIPGHTRRRHH